MKKTILGVALILLSILFMFYWEKVGREKFTYVEILTVNKDVEENEMITEGMLTLKRVSSAGKKAYRVGDYEKVIGLKAGQYIPEGAELYEKFFYEEDLRVDREKGEYILAIPKSWILSMPQTLRRGDHIALMYEGEKVLETVAIYVKDNSNQEVRSNEDRLDGTSTVTLIEILVTEEESSMLYDLIYDEMGKERGKFVLIYN